jgi:hypothetical protein
VRLGGAEKARVPLTDVSTLRNAITTFYDCALRE